ncbi:MAG: phosphatidylglycerophosphatase A [Bradymonadaceae bacterium]|nr:phosphatidylglycerophosphatase A [Lujinxingiaceae bacterium]
MSLGGHRRPANWRSAWSKAPVSMAFATVGGVGHLPGGPGTYAAALMLAPIWWMKDLPLSMRLLALAVTLVLSVVCSDRAGRALGEHDSSQIVIDEVVGVWVALVFFDELTWPMLLAGFVAFRILDMLKPPPAHWFDREVQSGLGVVLDDVVAGLWALPLVWLVAILL